MIYQSECRFCETETEWEEPHQSHLPRNHPKRKWLLFAVCGECGDAYGPQWMSGEWDTVRLETVPCHFCNNRNVRWVGTPDWANPETLLRHCDELLDESGGSVTFTTDLRKQFARVTAACRECAQSTSETKLYNLLKLWADHVTLERPMWEPIEIDDWEPSETTDFSLADEIADEG